MRFGTYMLNENMVQQTKNTLSKMDVNKLKKFLQSEFMSFVDMAKSSGIEMEVVSIINKGFGTRYRNLDEISRQRLRESVINEDLSHWWDTVKSEGFPTLAFYPALNVWLELDKVFQGQDINIKRTIVYSLFWLLLISGKYIRGWMDWKKQNPDEYKKERMRGKGGIV